MKAIYGQFGSSRWTGYTLGSNQLHHYLYNQLYDYLLNQIYDQHHTTVDQIKGKS